ncbi:MAG: thioredoxin domain-containing protein [Christensenellales bacterium]|jgi:uncharacterized protein YyaL (SSP411 family)
MSTNKKANRLIHEKSPYLQQHAHNPVDWYPWCEEAFAQAKAEDKPVFLSIGYSTCHWCHVMERESFENEDIAALLNKGFVSVKVDREERPDIDEVYMSVCQAMTGSGGWPLTILMTPDKKPFFAGTYLPPYSRNGMTGLNTLLKRAITLWRQQRDALVEQGEKIARFMAQERTSGHGGDAQRAVKGLSQALRAMYEPQYGGFSRAPKFPMPHYILYLMCEWKAYGHTDALDMAKHTLRQMARGGIYDHVGGGFSRYSTDMRWLVPHFEKMLYDNALLLYAYAEMYAVTGEDAYRRVAAQTANYLMHGMQSPEGGYYSALDADSEGEEGKFYVWEETELAGLLQAGEVDRLRRWGLTPQGNFEGKTILNLIGAADEPDDKDIRLLQKLFEIRKRRVPPFKDTKISASWNGLAIEGMARASAVLSDEALAESAVRAAKFVMTHMADEQGLICGTWLTKPGGPALLADWANMANGLLSLYTVTQDIVWLEKAKVLAEGLLQRFADSDGFSMTSHGAEALLIAPRDAYDGAMPSGSSCAVRALQRLWRLTGEEKWQEAYNAAIRALLPMAESSPPSHAHLITTVLIGQEAPRQVIIVADAGSAEAALAYRALLRRFDPFTTVIWYDGSRAMQEAMPFLKSYNTDKPFAAWVCENRVCKKPEFSAEELIQSLPPDSPVPKSSTEAH